MTPRERRVRQTARTHAGRFTVLSAFVAMIMICIAAVVGMLQSAAGWAEEIPDISDPDSYLLAEPTTILASDGSVIAKLQVQNRSTITLDEMSPYITRALIDTEDERFYEHGAIDLIGIARAFVSTLSGRTEGASTITQQLARNLFLTQDQTISRKVKEILISFEIEEQFTKDEILELYLNTVYFGSGAYGIEAAAQTYLGKSASDLTLAEAAMLVGIPNSPNNYDPSINPDLCKQRRNIVLDRMLTAGDITQEEHDAAQAEDIVLDYTPPSESGSSVYKYPFFSDYVKNQLLNTFSYDMVYKGGLTVHTTLDPSMQDAAEHAVTDTLSNVGNDAIDAGMIGIDQSTGAVKVMVGGKSYNSADQYNNATDAERQPGSSFKTITLATAIEQGMSPDTLFDCSSPMTIHLQNGTDWKNLQNYGNHDYGTISLARMTEVSANTGYAQVINLIGPDKVAEMGNRLGIDKELPANASLTLGTTTVSPYQMAEAYATIANGGVHIDPYTIEKVEDTNGNVIYEASPNETQAVAPSVAKTVTDILEGVMTDGTGTYGMPSINQPVAGKTGTTENVRDLWFCGYTPQITVAIWTGISQEQPMKIGYRDAQTSDLPLPIFRKFCNQALADYPREEFPTANDPDFKPEEDWGGVDLERTQKEQQEAEEEQKRLEEEQRKKEEEEERKRQEELEQQQQQQNQNNSATNGNTGGNANSGGNVNDGGAVVVPPGNVGGDDGGGETPDVGGDVGGDDGGGNVNTGGGDGPDDGDGGDAGNVVPINPVVP